MGSKVFLKHLADFSESDPGGCLFCGDKEADTRHITLRTRKGDPVGAFHVCHPCLVGITGSFTDCLVNFNKLPEEGKIEH